MKVLVTGGHGFLGQHLRALLKEAADVTEIRAPRSREFDLRDAAAAEDVTRDVDCVIHLAAIVGGIGYNIAHPATLIHDNSVMGLNVLEAARKNDVKRVVIVGSACAYPGDAAVPTPESCLWDGAPETSNAPYGIAKRMLAEAAIAYARQYGLNITSVIPTNLYGPGDEFDPARAHVLPSLMTRFHRAKLAGDESVTCWGTGEPTRDLLFVKDCARLIAASLRVETGPEPINLGTGEEISIREIAEAVRDAVGFKGELTWDTTKPNGQARRALAVDRMHEVLGKMTPTTFVEGMRETYAYFLTTQWAKSGE